SKSEPLTAGSKRDLSRKSAERTFRHEEVATSEATDGSGRGWIDALYTEKTRERTPAPWPRPQGAGRRAAGKPRRPPAPRLRHGHVAPARPLHAQGQAIVPDLGLRHITGHSSSSRPTRPVLDE